VRLPRRGSGTAAARPRPRRTRAPPPTPGRRRCTRSRPLRCRCRCREALRQAPPPALATKLCRARSLQRRRKAALSEAPPDAAVLACAGGCSSSHTTSSSAASSAEGRAHLAAACVGCAAGSQQVSFGVHLCLLRLRLTQDTRAERRRQHLARRTSWLFDIARTKQRLPCACRQRQPSPHLLILVLVAALCPLGLSRPHLHSSTQLCKASAGKHSECTQPRTRSKAAPGRHMFLGSPARLAGRRASRPCSSSAACPLACRPACCRRLVTAR